MTLPLSVYEVQLDLTQWHTSQTNHYPAFAEALLTTIPSLETRECTEGQKGAFSRTLRKGTHFAHVIEHVIVELIRLAYPDAYFFDGWIRETGDGMWIIHYSAPDFLSGRLGAILGVDVIKRLTRGDAPNLDQYVNLLRRPLEYFSQDDNARASYAEAAEPIRFIQPRPYFIGDLGSCFTRHGGA